MSTDPRTDLTAPERAALDAAAAALPFTAEEIWSWLRRHGLSDTPGIAAVLPAIRRDILGICSACGPRIAREYLASPSSSPGDAPSAPANATALTNTCRADGYHGFTEYEARWAPPETAVDAPSRPTGTPGPSDTCATKETT